MRMMRGLIPIVVLILGSLACFATAEDEDDSSVPMSGTNENDVHLPVPDSLPTFTPSVVPTITPGPSPTPYPTTDPAQNEAFDISTDADEGGGIGAVLPLVGIMGLAFGAFGVVVARTKKSKRK